ncbi:hypothetical protein M0Q97_12800 [Candidatus Dojkabacteria bacterium]|nr:hypothetical protein [Candidatus Dojkabacteria bacterium]
MGCWNGTCMISNLPILAGEKVKLVFLHRFNESNIKKPAYCYPNGIFHPGAFAINAEYDDYGGVENIEEDINFQLIEAYFKTKYKKIEVEGKVLDEFTIYDIIGGIKGGNLKVFSEGNKERKELAQNVVKHSQDFFSSDNIKNHWENLANMDVSEQWQQTNLNFVMIRKDVWDYIIKEHNPEFYNENSKTYNDIYTTAQGWVENKFEKFKNTPISPFCMAGYAGGTIMFLNQYYDEFISKCDDEQLDYIKNLFIEFIIIDNFLSETRKGWMITSGAGSQSQEWTSYKLLNKIINNICDENMKEEYE